MERRLAAVLVADVVGYGRLSQADEEGTRECFQADFSEVFIPKINEHRGRLVKTMGDGLLVEFRSVVDALRCATEVQRIQSGRNGARAADRRLEFRIGINLGDVIVEGDDIHGDGVIIAERLQTLAEPGGICVSGTVFDQVDGKFDLALQDAGRQVVKNISHPVRTYRVHMDEHAFSRTKKERGAAGRGPIWLVPWAGLAIGAATAAVLIWQPWAVQTRDAGIEYHLARRYEDAVSAFRAVDRLDLEAHLYLVVSLLRAHQAADAREEAGTIMQKYPRFSISEYLERPDSLNALHGNARADFVRDLRAAGLPEYASFDCLTRGDCP